MKITDKYVFFYNEEFSQWETSYMTIDGVRYNCAEQYMMHQKALLFGDLEIANLIMKTIHPRDHKALGKLVSNFDEDTWRAHCVGIVYKGNLAKFTQNLKFKELLLSYGDRTFVEASPSDALWGIKMGFDAKGIEDPANWRGANLLGEVITMVRNVIKMEETTETKWI